MDKFTISTLQKKLINRGKSRTKRVRTFSLFEMLLPYVIGVIFFGAIILPSPIFASDPIGTIDNALIGKWSAEWGDLHYNSRSIELKPDGTFIDSSRNKNKRKSSSTRIFGVWETIEGCVLKLSPSGKNSEHYFLYYRIEKRSLCYFSTSSILQTTEDGRLTTRDKNYRRQGKRNQKKRSIDGIWVDDSTGAMAFSFYKNGTFVRRRLSNKPEQWSQIGYEFLLWDKARVFVKE